MAKYLKIYYEYESDIRVLRERLKESLEELEMKLIEGEDSIPYDSIKEETRK